jgi:hypothetical protein
VEEALSEGLVVKLDFSQVKELHPCGTLVFMSRLDIWLEKHPNRLTCNYPEDDVVEQLFQHVSVLSRLGLSSRKKVDHERVAFWHFHCGATADPSAYKDLTLSVIDRIDHPVRILFADCLVEAVCNTVGHAYEFEGENGLPKSLRKWWIFSQYKEGRLYVAIYDAGIGIPSHLRKKPEWTEFLRIRQYKDARLIQSAIVTNRTSTKLPERGKGLPEMLEFSQMLHAGGLSIWSGKGGFIYDAQNGQMKRKKFTSPLGGTLVQWEIPFRKEQKNANENDLNS